VTENVGGWGVWVDVPEKSLWGHGENSIHRRYETPQMYVFLTLFRDHPISTEKDPLAWSLRGLLGV